MHASPSTLLGTSLHSNIGAQGAFSHLDRPSYSSLGLLQFGGGVRVFHHFNRDDCLLAFLVIPTLLTIKCFGKVQRDWLVATRIYC